MNFLVKKNKTKIYPTQRTILIIDALGGDANILDCTSCITRLRVKLFLRSLIDEKKLFSLGISKIVYKNEYVHFIIGLESEDIAKEIDAVLTFGSKTSSLLAFDLVDAFGGKQNIIDVDSCLTRLRVFVDNINLVDKNKILLLGAANVYFNPQSVHAVFGLKSDDLKKEIELII